MLKKWEKVSSKTISKNRIFSLNEDLCLSPKDGEKYPFFILDTLDWVNIIPLTAENEVIMVKQFRHGTQNITLEIPGGMTDQQDESPQISALRELIEETGYSGNDIKKIGCISPNPAIFNNLLHIYLVKNVVKKTLQNLEGTEDIEIEKIHIAKIPDFIKNGQISHALVIAAFYFYFSFYQ